MSPAPMAELWCGLAVQGPLTRDVRDSAWINDLLRGNLASDRYRCDDPPMPFLEAASTEPRRLRVALNTRSSCPGLPLAPEVVAAAESMAATLADLGHDVRVDDRRWPEPLTAFVALTTGGLRDEVRHTGHPDRVERATKAHTGAVHVPVLPEWWGRRRAARVTRRATQVFDDHDLLLTPALGSLPKAAGGLGHSGATLTSLRNLWAVPFTTLWNVCGNPAATLPAGFTPGGLPLSVQLVAPMGDECTLYSVAAQIEAARPWAQHRPALATVPA